MNFPNLSTSYKLSEKPARKKVANTKGIQTSGKGYTLSDYDWRDYRHGCSESADLSWSADKDGRNHPDGLSSLKPGDGTEFSLITKCQTER